MFLPGEDPLTATEGLQAATSVRVPPPESGGAGEIREGGDPGNMASIKDIETVPTWGAEPPGTVHHVFPTPVWVLCALSMLDPQVAGK